MIHIEVVTNLLIKLRESLHGVQFAYDQKALDVIYFRDKRFQGKMWVRDINGHAIVSTFIQFQHPVMKSMDAETLRLISESENWCRRGLSIISGFEDPMFCIRTGFIADKGRSDLELHNAGNDILNVLEFAALMWDYFENQEENISDEPLVNLPSEAIGDADLFFRGVQDFAGMLGYEVHEADENVRLFRGSEYDTTPVLILDKAHSLVCLSVLLLTEDIEEARSLMEDANLEVPYGHFSPTVLSDGQAALQYHVHQYIVKGININQCERLFMMLDESFKSLEKMIIERKKAA